MNEKIDGDDLEYAGLWEKKFKLDGMRIMLGDELFHCLHRKIAFLCGRPVRDNPIGTDDIIDLAIALEEATSSEDFLRKVIL